MKTAKLVIGIISIVLFVFVSFQSCAAGLSNAISDNGEISGSAGFFLALCLLAAGILAICTRNGGRGGCVSAAFYIVAGLIGLLCAGSYGDLYIWSGLSIIFGIICILGSTGKQKTESGNDVDRRDTNE